MRLWKVIVQVVLTVTDIKEAISCVPPLANTNQNGTEIKFHRQAYFSISNFSELKVYGLDSIIAGFLDKWICWIRSIVKDKFKLPAIFGLRNSPLV